MRPLKWLLVLGGVGVVAATVQALVVTRIEIHQAGQNALRVADDPVGADAESGVAVVYFSRSGTTALVARHLARRLDARLHPIEASDYRLGVIGWINALMDARKHQAANVPATLDLAAYETVYLGSPIWMYSPSPPIWDFVERNRFDGKHVILFNTYNSTFKQEFIDGFRDKVMEKGARSFAHRSIRRGRMGGQISAETLLREVDAQWLEGL